MKISSLYWKKFNHVYNRTQLDTNILLYDEIANHIESTYIRLLFMGHCNVENDVEELKKGT